LSWSDRANAALSNLGSTAVNAHVVPDSGSARDLGATGGFAWRRLYVNELRDNSDAVTMSPTQSTLNGGGNEVVFWNTAAFRIMPNILLQFMSSAFGFLSFKIDDTQTGSTTYTLPMDGTAGQLLQTDGGGNLSWTSAGTGTVTTVTSANADISVATPTSTPELTLNSGTGADQIVKRNSSAEIDAGTQKVINVVDPTAAQDAATKNYVDSKTTGAYYATVVSKTSGSVTANTTIPSWSAPTKNTGSAFNATTGEYTVPADGDYDVDLSSYLPASGSISCDVRVNGTIFITGSAGVAGNTRGSVSVLLPNLVASDIITVTASSSVTISEIVLCVKRVVGS
jgi:hypothetical protein